MFSPGILRSGLMRYRCRTALNADRTTHPRADNQQP